MPTIKDAHPEFHIMSGYRAAGERAIRIDMLERLADMLRAEDSRTGFEAKADMLSITGMTLEQFADLMQGLGYKAERGERAKLKPAEAPKAETPAEAAAEAPTEAAERPEEAAPAPAEAAPDAPTEESATAPTEAPSEATAEVAAETPAEMEVFFTFTWGRKPPSHQGRPNRGRGAAPQGQGAQAAQPQAEGEARAERGERSGKPRGKGKPQGGDRGGDRNKSQGGDRNKGRDRNREGDKPQQGAKTYEARPPRAKDRIDPDNPFAAALMGLRDKT